jgi:hypothetical protein
VCIVKYVVWPAIARSVCRDYCVAGEFAPVVRAVPVVSVVCVDRGELLLCATSFSSQLPHNASFFSFLLCRSSSHRLMSLRAKSVTRLMTTDTFKRPMTRSSSSLKASPKPTRATATMTTPRTYTTRTSCAGIIVESCRPMSIRRSACDPVL